MARRAYWIAGAAAAALVVTGIVVASVRSEKSASYRTQAETKWAAFQRWAEGGFRLDSRDRIRTVEELDNLLYELQRAEMHAEHTAVALVYEKIAGIIRSGGNS